MMGMSDLHGNWELVPLGHKKVCIDVQPGFACGKKNIAAGIPHLRMNNISTNGIPDFTLIRRIPKEIAEKKNRWLNKGDILFCNTNSTELVGKTCHFSGWQENCTFSNHLTRLKANPKYMLSEWLSLSLRNLWLQGYFALNCTEFIGQSGFNKDKLKEVKIPVPPIEEQRRIVTRIEELTSRVEKAKQLRAKAIEEADNILYSKIISIYEPKNNWIRCKIADVCTMKTGKTPPTKHKEYFGGEIPFVCPAELGQHLDITSSSRSITKKAILDKKANLFDEGTVLLVGIGSTVGKVGIAKMPLTTNQQITGLFFNEEVIPKYAAWFLFSQRNNIVNQAAGGGVPIINQNAIGELVFSYPKDKGKQIKIATLLDSLQKQINDIKKKQQQSYEELSIFTPALLAKAFRGDL